MNMRKILRSVARANGVTVKEVREEMQKSITEACVKILLPTVHAPGNIMGGLIRKL